MNFALSILPGISIALLMSCTPQPTEPYHPDPAVNSRYNGQSRASLLLRAQECGAKGAIFDGEVQAHGSPSDRYSKNEATVYRAGFSEWFSRHMLDRQTATACNVIKSDQTLIGMFDPPPQIPQAPPTVSNTAVFTQANPKSNKQNQPSYCPSGGVVLKTNAMQGNYDWSVLGKVCHVGDTVTIPADLTGAIASSCDFSKPVATANGEVFCTLGQIKPMRTE